MNIRSRSGAVLVLGDDTMSFLAAVRSLGRRGLAVDVGWAKRGAPATRSRYIREALDLPELGGDAGPAMAALNGAMRRADYEMVLPCYDSHGALLQRHRRELDREERYVLLSERAYAICASKRRTHELAVELGIPVPRQREVRTVDELLAAAGELGFPLVVKPVASVAADTPGLRRNVFRVADASEAARRFPRSWRDGVLVEENVAGRGVGVEFLARQGTIEVAFQHERLHEPPMGGYSTYRRSVALDPDLLDATRRLVRALDYTGVGMAEFKIDRDGRWVLLEINGRLWGSLPLTIAAGLDMPALLYELWCQGRSSPASSYRRGLTSRNWALDLHWLGTNLRSDRRDPSLLTVSMPRLLAEARRWLLFRERSDTFALDDPGPAVAELGEIRRWLAPVELLGKRLGRSRAERAARRALRDARSLLFVCLGNICRSPFAEGIAARPGRVSSAGTYPVAGRSAPTEAATAARRFGVDLANHRSRMIDRSLVEAADVILIFDRFQESELAARFPQAGAKVHYLGALAPDGPLEIDDPFGGSVERFVEIYELIRRAVAALD